MAYSGLQTIFDELGPGTGAAWAGEREALAQQADLQEQLLQQQRQRELMLKNAQSEKINPLLVQHQGLQNQGLELGLSGITADSSLKATNAAKAAGTLATDISAGNSNNQTTIGANQVKQGLANGQLLAQAAATLEATPPVLRTQQLMGMLKQYGIDPQSPQVQGIVSKIPPEQMPAALRKLGEQVARSGMTAAEYNNKDIHAATNQATIESANIHAGATRYAADKGVEKAAAALQAKAGKAQTMEAQWAKSPPATRIGLAKVAIDTDTDPFTHEPLTPERKKYFQAAYAQDEATLNAQIAARVQAGIAAQVGPDGKVNLANKPGAPTVAPNKLKGSGTAADPYVLK